MVLSAGGTASADTPSLLLDDLLFPLLEREELPSFLGLPLPFSHFFRTHLQCGPHLRPLWKHSQ